MNKELKEILLGFKRAISLVPDKDKQLLLGATVIMIIVGVLTNLPALIIGQLVDRMIASPHFSFNLAIPSVLTVLIIILIREALTVIRKLLVEEVTTQTLKRQTVTVTDHLLRADLNFINQQQIGSLHGRVLRSLDGLIRVIKLGFLEFFPTLFSALSAIIIAILRKPTIAAVMLLVIPTGLYLIFKQISSQKDIRVSLLRGREKIDGAVVEMLGGIETIRAADTTNLEVNKIEQVTENLRAKEIVHHLHMALFDAVKRLNEGLFYIMVVTLAIYLASQGIISKGDILVYSVLFISILTPLQEIHRILDQAHEGSVLVNDLHSLLTQPLDPSFDNHLVDKLNRANFDNTVEVKDLHFSYNSEPVLKGVSILIKKGESIGIVGASGCGKSTLIKLLLKLNHGYQGQISLFGQNLQTITRQQIAHLIAYIPQKTYIFSGTIRDNITYGIQKPVTQKQITEAAKKANIYHEIIHSLGGFDGKVAENGNNLSGGQKQRLAIARLILKSPELFIFDEATSALDNTNEAVVQKNIEQLFKHKTTITIAHRLTTLKNTDRIIVLDRGKVVQKGSYQSLATQPGLFKTFLEQGYRS